MVVISAVAVAAAACQPVPSVSAWLVGDSYGVGIDATRPLANQVRVKTGATIDNRLSALAEARRARPRALYVVAGINNAPNSGEYSYLSGKVAAGMDATKGAPCVVWATYPTRLSRSYSYLAPRVRTLNKAIRAEADKRSWVVVADFAPRLDQHPEWMAGDGLHLTSEGYRQLSTDMRTTAATYC